ncbi:hypothetical protein JL720_2797 [Aureococcus anophagefferens]|nr:hypothetical protein JL720_2797 [Aureococcus anophagefferens]
MALAARRLARRRSFAQHRDISTLILLRHGTSEWNGAEARFSGWCDIPLTADCQRRLDCFEDLVKPALFESANRAVLLVAHSNTLRALMAAIDEVPDDDVPALHVPNSVPILYRRRRPRARLREALQGSGTQSHARWMLTPENHAQVHDALESGGLLTRAFFESVDVKRNGAVSVRELDLSLTAYLKEAELGNNRIDCAVTAVAKKIVREARARDSTITLRDFEREVAAAAAALPKRDDQVEAEDFAWQSNWD